MSATIKDVARETGLSIATISKYINGGNVLEQNRALIADAIEKLGYQVNAAARSLKTNRTMTIGVLIPDLKNLFCTTIISSIENNLMQNGYSTIICDYGQNVKLESSKLAFLVSKQVDGIILLPSGSAPPELKSLIECGLPVVLIDHALEELGCDTVLVDNLNASYHAVELLITKGHRRIGIICGPDASYTARQRLKGYERVHGDYGMAVDAALVKKGDYGVDSGYRLFGELLNEPEPPTAVFVTNYEMTLGAVMAANERNCRFPDDLSFIGFDNMELAKVVKPSLVMVIQPMEQMGEAAAKTLLRRLKGDMGNFPALFRLKTEILPGQSVKERIV
jgi:LacI family transcriptional regulator